MITVSRLAEFRAAEKALQEQMAQLEALKKDAGLKREIEFEQKLVGLMKSYDKSLRDIIAILDPKAVARVSSAAPKQQRRARVVKGLHQPAYRRANRDQRRQPPWAQGLERAIRRRHGRKLGTLMKRPHALHTFFHKGWLSIETAKGLATPSRARTCGPLIPAPCLVQGAFICAIGTLPYHGQPVCFAGALRPAPSQEFP
ncbi:hypothetical protein PPS11_30041 [Pseudomonas putida S11]|nr:hypothetical protein PPS11_30041 [Pseudomonas putida S11]